MATKKTVKKSVPKTSPKPAATYKPHHRHFLTALVLFAGFSVYAITSFVSSTNSYIKNSFTDVLSSDGVVVDENGQSVDRDNPFNDLASDHQNYESIISLYYAGIVTGYDDGGFRADNKVNRAEFAKMLIEASDFDYSALSVENLSNCFTDVKDLPDHWFAPAVCAAKYAGWVGGYANGGFSPTQNINRAEALKIILNAFTFEIPENTAVTVAPYSDVELAGHWYLGVAQAAKDNGIIVMAGLFNADQPVSRGEIAQMIYNAMESKEKL